VYEKEGVMKRTNVVIDEKLVSKCLNITGIKTFKELVNYSLNEILRHEKQKGLLGLKGKITWEGDLDKLRAYR